MDRAHGPSSSLRIAMVAPLHESVPPKLYGGTERVVSYLTEELVRMGHEVTLYATGDSVTSARLAPMAPQGLRLDRSCHDPLAHHMAMIDEVAQHAHEYDVVHWNIDYLHLPTSRRMASPSVTTLHGRLDLPDLAPLYRHFNAAPLVSISDAQRIPLPWANWIATVHHGLPHDLLRPGRGRGGYLAFLGRISPEKRPDRAIRIARRVGIPLRIAAKVDRSDEAYFEEVVKPLLDSPGVEFVGEIDDAHKQEFLGNAAALLFPIDWPEPFGLVMIESMACATPVLAFACGSVPEIVEPNVSGWVVANEDDAVAALADLERFDRQACRRAFERSFSSQRMARDYVEVYARLAGRGAMTAARAA
jgi:glycosyltransferase involved in cell wall biosynthesis